jgi:hypothetical protein
MTATTRKSVPVTPEDAEDLERLRRYNAYREALTAVTGDELSEHPSDAEALHALIAAGRAALHEQVMATGYAALAAAQTDEDRQIAAEVTRRAGLLAD